jgi:hypothetical protein
MKEQQKQYLIDIMKADEELGLYNESLDKKSYLLGYTDATKKIDEFAIGFAEWIDSYFYQGDDVNEYHKSIIEYREGKIFTVKELLKIYKKEKDL